MADSNAALPPPLPYPPSPPHTSLPTTSVPPPSLQTTTVVVRGPPVPPGEFYYDLPPPITLNSPKEMKTYLQTHSKPHGYIIVTRRSGTDRSACLYVCHKSGTGEPKPKKLPDGTFAAPVAQDPSTSFESPKTNCPFQVHVPRISAGTGPDGTPQFVWKLSYDRPKDHVGHNHPPEPLPTLPTNRTITIPVGAPLPWLFPPANPAPATPATIEQAPAIASSSTLSRADENLPAIAITSSPNITSDQPVEDHPGVGSIHSDRLCDTITSPVHARAISISALTPITQQRILSQIDTLLLQASNNTLPSHSEVAITELPGELDGASKVSQNLAKSQELPETESELVGSSNGQIDQQNELDDVRASTPSFDPEAEASINIGIDPAAPTNTQEQELIQIADQSEPDITTKHRLNSPAHPVKKKKLACQAPHQATSTLTAAPPPRCQTRAQKAAAAKLTASKGKTRSQTRKSS